MDHIRRSGLILPSRFRRRWDKRCYLTPAHIGALASTGEGGAGGAPPDINIANVVALLHFDGTDGATSFTDVKGHTFTGTGQAQLDTAQARFGVSSLLCDGTGDSATSANHADWEMGSSDFTVEGQFRFAALTGSGTSDGLIAASTASDFHFMLQTDNVAGQHKLFWGITLAGSPTVMPQVYADWSPAIDTWYHIAGVRSGDNLYAFVGGVMLGQTSGAAGAMLDNNPALFIGQLFTVTNGLNGWADEVRITKGVARYTANFTPPAAAFPDS